MEQIKSTVCGLIASIAALKKLLKQYDTSQ
jgi:hypothetical protein